MQYASPRCLSPLSLIAGSIVLLLLAPGASAADDRADVAAELDKVLSAQYPPNEPGAAVLVARNGKVVLREGYGLANMEHNVPITPEAVFRIGSMSKFFTATAILMLMEQGKLDLEDEITRFLPEYPTHEKKIRIKHLIAHTSGVWDYLNLPAMQAGWREDITVQGLIDLFKDEPLPFEPGDGFAYSNSNYILLGAIIEKVTGQTYQAFVDERIFVPAGMRSTRYGGHLPIIPNRAAGYERSNDGYLNARFLNMTEPYAAGGHVSTVDDLWRWNKAYLGGQLITKKTLDRALTRFTLNNGKEIPVAFGCGISRFEGHTIIVYAGGIIGFSSQAVIVPDENLHVIMLSNNPRHLPRLAPIAAQLTAIALGKPLEEPKPVHLESEVLDSLTGTYRVSDDEGFLVPGGDEWILSREGDSLTWERSGRGRKQALLAITETEFCFKSNVRRRIEFVRDGDGEISEVLLRLPLLYPQRAVRTDK
ncbi:MAG: serine hydrolase [Planctomycetota bacterium]|jgi:CubicO group peptidase (beta-lactamase class C family)